MACDLHCHSKISDGSMGIEEIIATARRKGLTALSITDHDAVAGSTRACVIGKRLGVEVIHGVEMTAFDPSRGRKVHILGYLCDSPDRLEGTCRKVNASCRAAAAEMVQKILRYYPIMPDSITRHAAGSTNIYPQHIMHALLEAGYADSLYGDAYQKLLSPRTGSIYVTPEYPTVNEVVDLIHSAGGLVVLAHPYAYDSTDLMQELTETGRLDGVEVWHPRNTEPMVQQLQQYATAHNLLMTGGTDFHGLYTGAPRSLGSVSPPEDTVMLLKARKTARTK